MEKTVKMLEPKTPTATPTRNPMDNMTSTWRRWDKKDWKYHHWVLEILDVHHVPLDQDPPVHEKTDKVPHMPSWYAHRFVLFHSVLPLVLQQLYIWLTGKTLHPIVAGIYFGLAFNSIGINEFHVLRRLGMKFGFFDGDKHARDGVPDVAVRRTVDGLNGTAILRMAMNVCLTYDRNLGPTSINWVWLPLEIGLYGIVLDFWFYWYHRSMHDIGVLWKYHRTHHLTKHPNPLLTIYADHEQEFFDIIGCPFLAWASLKLMGLPMGFYDWWMCHHYVVFGEVLGHSGLRIHCSPPSTLTWALQLFKAELVIEDHDLHHRVGWRHSANYGKQTRLWDRVFGTCRERIESTDSNVVYDPDISFPLF